MWWFLIFAAVAADPASVFDVTSESHALQLISSMSIEDLSRVGKQDVDTLIQERKFLGAAGELIKRANEHQLDLSAHVRPAVQKVRNQLDNVIRALDVNYGKESLVSPAFQWAQNSTHVFLSVKFVQRWNSPGALEVQNATVSIAGDRFHFSAVGEHSYIVKRYTLDLELAHEVDKNLSTWNFASVGRMTVILGKKERARWPGLLRPGKTIKNMGIWQDMRDKWAKELQTADYGTPAEKKAAYKKKQSKKQEREADRRAKREAEEAKRRARDDEDEDDEDEEEEQKCDPSPIFQGTKVRTLCREQYPVEEGKWLVKFVNERDEASRKKMRQAIPVWRLLADQFTKKSCQVAVVDCTRDPKFCTKEMNVKSYPEVRKYVNGKLVMYTGELIREDLMQFVHEREEL